MGRPSRLEMTQRKAEILKLRLRGMNYTEIAAETGLSTKTVTNYIRDAVAAAWGDDAEQLDKDILKYELLRLDKLLEAVWDKAMDGDPQAIEKVIKIMDRRAKYLGLDAAQKITLESPEPIQFVLAQRENGRSSN